MTFRLQVYQVEALIANFLAVSLAQAAGRLEASDPGGRCHLLPLCRAATHLPTRGRMARLSRPGAMVCICVNSVLTFGIVTHVSAATG